MAAKKKVQKKRARKRTTQKSVETPAKNSAEPGKPTSFIPALIAMRSSDVSDDDIARVVNGGISDLLEKNTAAQKYNVLFLYDPYRLQRSDADRIYTGVTGFTEKKPILLILSCDGGNAEAAYFIAKLCREYTSEKFVVTVPRRAKSAAALICCAADEIHMGSLSELGPIDPQFEGKPALGLKNAIEHIAELVKRYPAATDMFSSYLAKSVKLEDLGYYERVAESAAQYAERLLNNRSVAPRRPIESIASRLVYDYKDHGFAIDSNEASDIFGSEIIKKNTDVYRLGNEVYEKLDVASIIIKGYLKRNFYFTGSAESACYAYKKK